MNAKIAEMITNKIIEKLEHGVIAWKRPWTITGLPMNYKTKKHYRGINIFLLALKDYACPFWLTFRQVNELKGKVKKGSKGTTIIFWQLKEIQETVALPNGLTEERTKKLPCLRYYTVFNLEQTEGIDYKKDMPAENKFNPIEQAEQIINNYEGGPEIKTNGGRTYYSVTCDYIGMPRKESFENPQYYYSTLFHEMTHSTGAEKRLNRKTVTDATYFGSENYSKEELIAELGASFLCSMTGIDNITIDNSASYIKSWLEQLKNDKTLIISAAAQAQKAVDYITANR